MNQPTKSHLRAYMFFGIVTVIVIMIVGSSTLSGRRISQVFSNINSGLTGSGSHMPSNSRPTAFPFVPTAAAAAGNTTDPNLQPTAIQNRIVIRNAELSIEVTDVTQSDEQVRTLVSQVGGYLLSSSTSGEGNELSINLSTKVPASQFDATLNAFQAMASKVRSRSVTGEDVTEEFVDITARLHTLEITRDRVESLLSKATLIDDMIKINTSLSEIQGQIEQIQGRMQYLSQSAAFSTIELRIQPVPVVALNSVEGWQPVAVARGALHNVIAAGQGLLNLLIIIAIWTPFLLPFLLLAWWIWRRFGHGRNHGRISP